MSDRLTVRLISRLARASARKRAYTPAETNAETNTQRHTARDDRTGQAHSATGPDERERPAATAMSAEERAAIRQAGADDARRSRTRQGLPERIEDPAAVAVLAALLRDVPAPRPPRYSSDTEKDSAA